MLSSEASAKKKKKLRHLRVKKAQAPHGAELLCGRALEDWS